MTPSDGSIIVGEYETVPWVNVDQIRIAFTEDVTVIEGDLDVYGVNVAEYSIVGFGYDPGDFIATWTLSGDVTADKLLLVLDDDVISGSADVAEVLVSSTDWPLAFVNWLGGDGYAIPDGEVDDPSGGDFRFRINVLPGDADSSEAVNSADVIEIRRKANTAVGGAEYSIYHDVDGSGQINSADVIKTRRLANTSLPVDEPVQPPSALFSTFAAGIEDLSDALAPPSAGPTEQVSDDVRPDAVAIETPAVTAPDAPSSGPLSTQLRLPPTTDRVDILGTIGAGLAARQGLADAVDIGTDLVDVLSSSSLIDTALDGGAVS
jgi:hypothetical protein